MAEPPRLGMGAVSLRGEWGIRRAVGVPAFLFSQYIHPVPLSLYLRCVGR